ncbi:MAG: hypothetical protein JJU11_16425 [Candidatus Sumerlaeia bacterium]|nr:hypothetical protein [Candidatus Sumerlaeia bacterium]
MKKIVFPIAIILLVVIGGAGIYVIVDTDGALEMIGLRGPEPVAAPVAAEPAEETETAEAFDRRTAAATDSRTGRQQRPPTREEIEAASAAPVEETVNIPITRMGRFIGSTSDTPSADAPRQELYPFAIRKRSYPESNVMAIEFAIRNSSGSHWRNAYVTFRSDRHPQGQRFQIEDWQIDETVGIEYRFPSNEVTERLAGFRLVSISGQRRESALAELLSQDRNRFLEYALISSQSTQVRRRDGDRLTAPGLLGMIGQFQAPVTGIQVRPATVVQQRERRLEITIPREMRIPANLDLVLRETSEERREANAAMKDFHQHAQNTETAVEAFIAVVNQGGVQSTSEEGLQRSLQDLRRELDALNRSGERLARLVRLSRDTEVKRLQDVWLDYSRRVVGQLDRVEAEMRRIDPNFEVQG